MDLQRIQAALVAEGLDGWLFYDFHNRDPIAYRVLGLEAGHFTSRRWFYYVPAIGTPRGLAHRVEPRKLDSLPGEVTHYLAWQELHRELRELLGAPGRVAMQYSPMADIPYVSTVDGGTVELVRSCGHEVVSSADLVQLFEAAIDEKGYRSHLDAAERIQRIKDEVFALIGDTVRTGGEITEYEAQQFIIRRFGEEGLTCEGEWPIVGVNDHPADPHFQPTADNARVIKKGDCLLIDLWAKLDQPGSIYYDITWCAYLGQDPPPRYVEIFDTVRAARQAAVDFVRAAFAAGETVYGWQVDEACRNVVRERGYAKYFIHRTGHSIGEAVHGNGVHIDNLETKETRRLIPGICFSIEPGIYLPGEMAVRSEIDCFITEDHEVVVAGDEQQSLILYDV